jgi:L-malate glycosyltransferase
MKNIVILAPGNSIHTKRWVDALSEFYEVHLFTLQPSTFQYDKVNVVETKKSILGFFKLIFFIWIYQLKSRPKIVHAHYASSYGFLLSFIPHKKKVLSIWGSDVYEFPEKSYFHRLLLKFNLRRSNILTSTSNEMAKHAKLYTNKNFLIVPFGINTSRFCLTRSTINRYDYSSFKSFKIGTVKSLSHKYGIDTLIYAIDYIQKFYPKIFAKLTCEIYGIGPDLEKLTNLTQKLGLSKKVIFCGHIDQKNLPYILNKFDIFLALSRMESFGVSVIEAQACGVPVIVSDVGGLIEVVNHNKTGLIVPHNDHQKAAEAIMSLIHKKDLGSRLAKGARKSVEANYVFEKNVSKMIEIYEK